MGERDGLKPLAEILEPDIRNTAFVCIDRESGKQRPITLDDHYANIQIFELNEEVPEEITIQFDLARNIYVYAWFEYRFYNVAEAKVLTVLELAMKNRISEKSLKRYINQREQKYFQKNGKKVGLRKGMKTLMEYCRDHQLVVNGGFSAWKNHASVQAYYRKLSQQNEWAIAEMDRTGESLIELPDIVIEELPPDPNYDHIQHLIDHTNKSRNNYAHGSTMLHNQVLDSFEMVSEFINQLYK